MDCEELGYAQVDLSMVSYMYVTISEFTVFPRNLTVARFYFKAPFGVVTIRGRLDFEGGVYRDRRARAYTTSIISLFVDT